MKATFLLLICLFVSSCAFKIKQDPCSTELFVEIRKTDTSCDTIDGGIIVQISGGTPPYSYQWKHDASLNSDNIANLESGLYEVTISDSEGRQTISQIIIN